MAKWLDAIEGKFDATIAAATANQTKAAAAARAVEAAVEAVISAPAQAPAPALTTVEGVKRFILAGNATFTLVSKKTGTRFTYRVRKPEERKGAVSHFVHLLTGSDNENSYTYLGQLYRDEVDYARGQKSPIRAEADSNKAFDWLAHILATRTELPASMEFHHAGKCARCGRKLTVPSSIESGFGPECAQHV